MALSIVRQDIALKANNFLQNIDQMTCQKIAEQLNKIKNEVKRYAIDLLIFFHDIDIYENNSNIKTENKLQEFIEYKNGFLKALLPYFIAIIMYKLNNLSPKVKIEFCACLIEAICAKAPGISPGYYNIKVCNKNPWKLVIDELLQTFSNEDLPMIIIDWIVQNNNCELMKKVLSNPIFLEQINYPHNREFKARMLRKALHNFAFEMAELLIHHKLYPAQENLRTNWLNEILDLLALIPDDENSINQCCKLIRLLFEHGTQLEGKLLQILIFGGYNTAIERNLCFRMREQEDPENSIKKLLEDAKDKALRFY